MSSISGDNDAWDQVGTASNGDGFLDRIGGICRIGGVEVIALKGEIFWSETTRIVGLLRYNSIGEVLKNIAGDGHIGYVRPDSVVYFVGDSVVLNAPGWKRLIDDVALNKGCSRCAWGGVDGLKQNMFFRVVAGLITHDDNPVGCTIGKSVHRPLTIEGQRSGVSAGHTSLDIPVRNESIGVIKGRQVYGRISVLLGIIMAVRSLEGVLQHFPSVNPLSTDRIAEPGELAVQKVSAVQMLSRGAGQKDSPSDARYFAMRILKEEIADH